MHYHNITHDDIKNGDGLRIVLWVSGCDHHCKKCQNPVTWDPNGGLIFDDKAKEELFSYLDKDYIAGITFSGGDPLYIENREEIFKLCKEIKNRFPEKTIWIYTGYLFTDVISMKGGVDLLNLIDVVVDGEYEEVNRNTKRYWCGSDNQIVWRKIDNSWYPTKEYENSQ